MIDDSPYVYAIAIVVCGVIGAAVAQMKQGSLWQGFCWGFVLGPIGWIIVAVAFKPAPAPASPNEDDIAAKMYRARELARKLEVARHKEGSL